MQMTLRTASTLAAVGLTAFLGTVGCRAKDDTAAAPASPSASGSAAMPTQGSMRPMEGTPAPPLAPGEVRPFGDAQALEGEAISVRTLLDTCLETDALCTVEGQVGAACRSSGCWFTLTGDGVSELILVEMEDEAFTIPKNAAGTQARMRGRLTRTTFAPSEAHYYATEAARALGKETPARADGEQAGYLLTIVAAELTKPADL